jgi:McrBC 5-methylcytosine restriction system component
VFSAEEHGEINIPLELVFKNNSLNIYEAVLGHNYFRIHLRSNRLVVQAGGFLGLFPLNDFVAVEVRARVPVSNLERILLYAPQYTPEYLPEHLQSFAVGSIATPSLLDVLAQRLLQAVEQIYSEGLHYEYRQRHRIGSTPRGRLLPFASARHQATSRQVLAVASSSFERTYDTALNRCLRFALRTLLNTFRGMKDRKGARAIESRLAVADAHFQHVDLDHSMRFLDDSLIHDTSRLPATRASYGLALPVARVILLRPA